MSGTSAMSETCRARSGTPGSAASANNARRCFSSINAIRFTMGFCVKRSSPPVERDFPLADDGSGLQDSKRTPPNGGTQTRCGRSPRRVERTLDLSLQQQHGILCGQTFQSEAAHLTPEATLSRGHNERALAEQYRAPVPARPAPGEHRRGGSTPCVSRSPRRISASVGLQNSSLS